MSISVLIPILIPVLVIVIILSIFAAGYVKAPSDTMFIISGLRKKPKILIGKAGVKIPFFERKDTLIAKQISVDIKTNGYIPTLDFIGVDVDAVAKIALDLDSEEGILLAQKNFLNMNEYQIREALTDSLQGNMREIIGTINLKEICNNRQKFGDQVQEKAQRDMNALGVKIISCNIQRIIDENELINALGQDNMSKIQKEASIAKAEADRDVAIATAKAAQESADAEIVSQLEIAKKKNDLAIQKAELKKQSDIKIAEAEAAKQIEAEAQRKIQEIATADANLARQEKEIELKAREVEIMERKLEAEVKKTAEARKYAEQQDADARLYTVQKNSEAELFERQQKAEAEKYEAEQDAAARKATAEADKFAKEQEASAVKAQGLAEAEAIKAKGEAEAAAIKAKAEAEAEGLMKKAEAMAAYGDAAKQDMQLQALKVYFEQLPSIAKAVGEGYASVDKIVMLGDDSSRLAGNIMNTTTQVSESLSNSLGIDLKSLLAGFMGANLAGGNKEVTVNIDEK